MNLTEITALFDYTEWANHLALDAAEKLTPEQLHYDFKISHNSLHGTLAHMAGAEWIWLERWRGTSPTTIWNTADFDDLTVLRVRWREVELQRRELLDGLTEEQLHGPLSYRNLAGQPFTLPLVGQMQHVANHSTLHRGQVVGMVRQLGIQPPAVDLLYYLISKQEQ